MVFCMQDAWRCRGGVSVHTPPYTSEASEVMVFQMQNAWRCRGGGSGHTPPYTSEYYRMGSQGDPTSAKANSCRSLGGRRGERDFAEMLSDGFRSAGKHLVKAPGLSTGTLVVRKGHAEAFTSVGSWGGVPFLLVAPCLCQLRDLFFSFLLACRVAALHTCRASVT